MRFVRSPLLLLPLVFASDALRAGPSASRWVQPGANGTLVYRADERGNTIPDFSRAGYRGGGVRLPDGRYVLVSNPNPKRRDPLTLAVSNDGLVFTSMGYLVGGRHVDYPHVIEHDGALFVAFATAKSTVEVLKVRVADLAALAQLQRPKGTK